MNRFIILVAVLLTTTKMVDSLPDVKITPIPMSEPTPVEKFMKKVAWIESENNHKIVNEFGMMGKYQFSPSTVRALGFKVSKKEFLNNPTIQDSVMVTYMRANHQDLSHYIKKYDGKMFSGIKVTRAGILAGAHFAGSGGVVSYFKNGGTGASDARGTTVKKYMSYFSNFNLPEI
jgi:hypothetical protein